MSTAAKRVPRIETAAAKRSRQKTADEVIVAATKSAPAKNSKRAKSTERSESKPRKPSVSRSTKQSSGPSRSASRSPSRQKRGAAKAALGPKVLTKKELENARTKRGASRSRRSPSVTRASKSKSTERKSRDRSRNKEDPSIADLQLRYGSDNVKRNTYFEDDDISPSSSRYSLRKRASPAAPGTPVKASSSSISISRRGGDSSKKCCWLSCGYLKYKKDDVCKIVVATVVLLVALAIINYFHLVDLAKIKDSIGSVCKFVTANLVTKPLGFCCDTSRAVIDSLKAFVTNAWTRIAS